MLTQTDTHRIFHGWYIVAAAFVILFFTAGARYSIGVMFKPMLAEFGWSRGTLSFGVLLNTVVFAVAVTAVGRVYDRYGPKWVIIVATGFLATGFMLTATINTLWQFLVCYGVLAALGLAGTSVPLMAVLTSKWFQAWRGLAISLALAGNCLGQFALMPLFHTFIANYGWRGAYLSIGGIMLVVNVVLALLVINGDPHQLGLQPYGRKVTDPQTPQHVATPAAADLTLRQAGRTRSFWYFLGVMGICGSGDFFVTTHLIPFVTDHGVPAATASNMLAWYGLMSLPGILIAGPASDLLGNKLPIASTFLLRIGLFGLLVQYQTVPMFYLFALAFGFTHLITAPLTPTLMGRLYGFRYLGSLTGPVSTVHHLAGGLWAYVGGVIFDWTGSYQAVFFLSAGTACLAFFGTVLITEERHRTP